MKSRLWPTGAQAWGAVGTILALIGLAWLTTWLLGKTSHDDGAGLANVLALPLGVLGLVTGAVSMFVALRAFPHGEGPPVLSSAARELLREVTRGEVATLQQLLGDSGGLRPADLKFAQPEAGAWWRTDGGPSSGSLDDIAAYYQSLKLGRLVVLGEPGAGKTVLALRLLLDLAAGARASLEHDPAVRVRVPVRLSLSTFTLPDRPLTPSCIHARLIAWLVAHIAEHLSGPEKVRTAVAYELVAEGWVVPILDGLDEMDVDHTQPDRARRVLTALNHPAWNTHALTMVLTCRSNNYHHLTHPAHNQTPSERPPAAVTDATTIVIQPLDPRQVTAWLAHRFPDPSQPTGVQVRWRRVVTTILRHRSGRLATCLSSPLRLYLACAVYLDPGSRPAELCELDPDTLNRHLLDHLVPALTQHHPRLDGTQYHPDHVTRWLSTLADHLDIMACLGRSSTDIHFNHLWATTGTPHGRRIRHQATAIAIVPFTLLLPTLGYLCARNTGHFLPDKPLEWFSVLWLGVGVLCTAHVANRARLDASPIRLDLDKFRSSHGRRHIIRNLGTGATGDRTSGAKLSLAAGLAAGLTVGLTAGLTAGLAVGITAGLSGRFSSGLRSIQDRAARPSEPLRQHIAGVIAIGLVYGLTLGLGAGLTLGFPTGITFGVVIGLVAGIIGADIGAALPRYILTVRTLRRTNQLPRHPARFLDWAHTAGLLRLAGAATQFRHRDLQHHFRSP